MKAVRLIEACDIPSILRHLRTLLDSRSRSRAPGSPPAGDVPWPLSPVAGMTNPYLSVASKSTGASEDEDPESAQQHMCFPQDMLIPTNARSRVVSSRRRGPDTSFCARLSVPSHSWMRSNCMLYVIVVSGAITTVPVTHKFDSFLFIRFSLYSCWVIEWGSGRDWI